MKRVLAMAAWLLTALLLATSPCAAGRVSSDGYCNGIRLAGKVRVVDYNPDLKVQVVTAFEDLKVKAVDVLPRNIGEWQFVDYGQDFTIKFVDAFPDIKIKFVDAFPGVS